MPRPSRQEGHHDDIGLAEIPTDFFSVVLPNWLTWTFAVLAIRLRRPRPEFRRIIRQPGLAAVLAASICAAILVASQLALRGRRGGLTWPFLPGSFYLGLPGYLAPTVFGSWLTLFLNRRWKGERGPIDCLGLGLGIGWISFYLAQLACEVLR
jgi:hypothetical protein